MIKRLSVITSQNGHTQHRFLFIDAEFINMIISSINELLLHLLLLRTTTAINVKSLPHELLQLY